MSATLEQLRRLDWPSVVRIADGTEWRSGVSADTWFDEKTLETRRTTEELLARGPVEIVEVATDSDEELVCPHCGYRHGEPMEFFEGAESLTTRCDECQQEFIATASYDVTYGSRKL